MVWLRQMGLAFIAFAITNAVFGVGGAIAGAVIGPVRLVGPIGGVLSLAVIVIGLFIAHRVYLVIERWDAIRSGRLPQG